MILLIALAVVVLGFIAGLNHCSYRLNKLFTDKPVVADYKPEPVRTYAMK